MTTIRPLHFLLLFTFFVFGQSRAQQADYPNRSVRVVVPFPPGGAPDLVGRTLANRLSERLGQPFVVENRTGAGGNIAVEAVAPLTEDAFRRWHLRRSLAAMGAATETDLRLYLTFPRFGAPTQKRMLAAAVADGEVVEITVDGDRGRWFALADDLPALERAAARRRGPTGTSFKGTTFLAPFDSLLWHRARTHRLFGFDYRIEVYTPAPQRRFGYYTLPILSDGRLVGRVDAKHHRVERRLALRHVAFETPLATPDAVLAGTAEAARSLATFVGATDVTIERVSPARLAAPLRRALAERA